MPSREVRCACGALNDEAFRTCIRCAAPLGADAGKSPTGHAAAVPTDPKPRYGPAVLLLGGLCAVVFAFQTFLAVRRGAPPPLLGAGSDVDAIRVGALSHDPAVWTAEPWRLLSAGFVHFGLLHFVLNMMAFVTLARSAERLLGPARTVVTFVVTTIAGSTLTVAVAVAVGDEQTLSAGASAGILGLIGLLVGVLLRRGDPRWKPIAIEGVLYTFLLGIAVNVSGVLPVSINNAAHLGGLVAGSLLGLGWGGKGASEGAFTRGVAALFLAASVGSLVLAQASERWRELGA